MPMARRFVKNARVLVDHEAEMTMVRLLNRGDGIGQAADESA
jgi:hypothetical protein